MNIKSVRLKGERGGRGFRVMIISPLGGSALQDLIFMSETRPQLRADLIEPSFVHDDKTKLIFLIVIFFRTVECLPSYTRPSSAYYRLRGLQI